MQKVQRTLGGDGESRSVTFDPPPMRRSSPRGASRDSQASVRTETTQHAVIKADRSRFLTIAQILGAIFRQFYGENVESL